MANIKLTVDYPIYSGLALTFEAPCDCTAVTGVKVYYKNITDTATTDASQTFTFRDAHGLDVSRLGNLFTRGVIVKVVLDTQKGYAYVQNADTNAYLETKFAFKSDKPTVLTGTLTAGSTSLVLENAAIKTSSVLDIYASKYGVSPSEAVCEAGKLTLTFDVLEEDLSVRVEVRA